MIIFLDCGYGGEGGLGAGGSTYANVSATCGGVGAPGPFPPASSWRVGGSGGGGAVGGYAAQSGGNGGLG